MEWNEREVRKTRLVFELERRKRVVSVKRQVRLPSGQSLVGYCARSKALGTGPRVQAGTRDAGPGHFFFPPSHCP